RIFVRMKELLDDLFDPMRPWGIPVSGGTCLRCSVCQCQMNKPCLHPERMSYSLEALRLNVEEIAEYYFDQRLTWFDGKTVPPRLSLLGGFLTGCTLENLFS
ncbi:MAG: hypothetical protein IKW74_06645, partial [Thermoguttaceae bacterium]|nr:hypothetical protein [Thermoguttaceae bacterium]